MMLYRCIGFSLTRQFAVLTEKTQIARRSFILLKKKKNNNNNYTEYDLKILSTFR